EAFDIGQKCCDVGIAVGRIYAHCLGDNGAEGGRGGRLKQELQQPSQCVDVGTLIQAVIRATKRRRTRHGVYTPVYHVHLPNRANHHILRLKVTVNNAVRVGKGQCLTDPSDHAQALRKSGVLGEVTVKTCTADQLHGVEGASVGQRPALINGHDSRMLEPGDQLGLTSKGKVKDLESDTAVELAVPGSVDDAHAAAADLGFQLVARPGQVGQRRHLAQMIEDWVAYFHTRPISARHS